MRCYCPRFPVPVLNFFGFNLAAYGQLEIGGTSIGPQYLYVMLGMLLVNIVFLTLFYQRLKITTFDPEFATSLGMRSTWINTAFMFLVSVTVTAGFNAAGAILVIALVITPPATAYLLSKNLPTMIALTVVIAVVGALAGFWFAYVLNAATSAAISVFYGVLFVLALAIERFIKLRRRRLVRPEARSVATAKRHDEYTATVQAGA